MTRVEVVSSALLVCLLSLSGAQGFHVETNIYQKANSKVHDFRQGQGSLAGRSNVQPCLRQLQRGCSAGISPRHRCRRHYHSSALFESAAYVNGKNDYDEISDILVIGSGPAARAIASILAANKLDVILADKNVQRTWPPNYGVWQDEWQAILDRYSALGVNIKGGRSGNSIDYEWSVTDCYFGGSFDIPTETRMRLDRPYYRVDRDALRDSLTPAPPDGGGKKASYKILRANHKSRAISVNVYEPAGSFVHDSQGTTVQLETAGDKILTVRSKLVIDCTGHETDLVLREARDVTSNSPGFQIAYGCLVDIDESDSKDKTRVGPYAKEAMTLFDYRIDHFDAHDEATKGKVASAPTFMYGTFCGDLRI